MSASLTLPAPGARRRPALWTLQILLALFFAFAGINKLLGLQQEMIDNFAKMGPGPWFRYLVGVLELTGAIGLLFQRLAGAAALWLGGVMVGAIFTHLFVQPPVYLAIVPAVLLGLFALIARARRDEIRALFGRATETPPPGPLP